LSTKNFTYKTHSIYNPLIDKITCRAYAYSINPKEYCYG